MKISDTVLFFFVSFQVFSTTDAEMQISEIARWKRIWKETEEKYPSRRTVVMAVTMFLKFS